MQRVTASLSLLLLLTLVFADQVRAGCDPCICGVGDGGGIPSDCPTRPAPPPVCSRGRSQEFAASSPLSPADLASSPLNPCAHAEAWQAALCDFAQVHLVHSAWGYEHSLRDYTLASTLAREEKIAIDDDVLFAAAMLHDMGGFAPYAQTGVDHALRSTQVVGPVLAAAGFPSDKVEAVKNAILHHSYYDAAMPSSAEGLLLHNADGLDFLGAVSAMRLLAIAGKDKATPDVGSALTLLQKLVIDVPKTMYGGATTHALMQTRQQELRAFVSAVVDETYGFGVPKG